MPKDTFRPRVPDPDIDETRAAPIAPWVQVEYIDTADGFAYFTKPLPLEEALHFALISGPIDGPQRSVVKTLLLPLQF